ncbi:amidase [Herbiconiux sp. VKM Ac-2851]|nr:amidase [Herbiconiux sp. VKM Ac-2851]
MTAPDATPTAPAPTTTAGAAATAATAATSAAPVTTAADTAPATPDLLTAGIAELRDALERGATTSVELVARSLERIAHFDRHGIALNAVPVLNPEAFADARASDARRARGETLGPLDGIPYTAKDSYCVEGLTVAAGSPAFEHLVAASDAFAIERLRAAGAVLIGLTTMPPMANGGMQRGVYGRAESPYDARYLPAAYASGSSNGSGVATAAGFAAFGLAEETWSSGRSPASNNALVAYTPSRGVISVRGNWPLVPTMDVVVPHTRFVADLLEVLDVLVADDPETRGDFWRVQPWVSLPAASSIRPSSYPALAEGVTDARTQPLAGRRLGVPRRYIGRDTEAVTPIETRASVLALWEAARQDLEALGAEVVEVDFPAVENYEADRPGRHSMSSRGLVPADFAERELWELSIWAWNDFLDAQSAANDDPALRSLAGVDGALIFPRPTGQLPDRWGDLDYDLAEYAERARRHGVPSLTEIPSIAEGVRGLEETRRLDLEQWMDELGLDALVFPAAADVGPADADTNEASATLAWRDGVWVSNGNLVPRHLGIPTVTVPMGLMSDTRMPVGLTLAGRAYSDSTLLRLAAAFEAQRPRRVPPPRTPPLPAATPALAAHPLLAAPSALAATSALAADQEVAAALPAHAPEPAPAPVTEATPVGAPASASAAGGPEPRLVLTAECRVGAGVGGSDVVVVEGECDEGAAVSVSLNGVPLEVERAGIRFSARGEVPAAEHARRVSEWREPFGSLVVATARTAAGTVGALAVAGGIA